MSRQSSPAVLCMQSNVISIRITSLYGSQPSCVDFVHKTATFGSELQISMGPNPPLCFYACKITSLASDLRVSMCPRPQLWFLHAKQRLFEQNYKSLWVPDLTCRSVLAKQYD